MVKKFKINLKDRKILAELNWDARISNTEIAKRAGLSKKSVEYRIKQLEKGRIIQSYYPIINFMKLGYVSKKMWFRLQYVNNKTKREMEEYIEKNPIFGWTLWSVGHYDFGISASIKKEHVRFNEEIIKFCERFGKYVVKKDFSETITLEEYPWSFLLNKKRGGVFKIKYDGEEARIDVLDKKILKELMKNARQSLTEMAKKIGSNYKTVGLRLKKLKEKGVLLGTRAAIDPQFFGKDWYKVFLKINYNEKNAIHIIKKYLIKQIELAYITENVGGEDIDFEMFASTNREFFKFVERMQEELKNVGGVSKYILLGETISKIRYIPEE
ncbi:MAG: AsnC family transcriptional regulator [Candidatus Woesearchaeota archaeon]